MRKQRRSRFGSVGAALVSSVALVVATGGVQPGVAKAEPAVPSPTTFEANASSAAFASAPLLQMVIPLAIENGVAASAALINSQPRAQGYGATISAPLLVLLPQLGVPANVPVQCWANLPPGETVKCGVSGTTEAPLSSEAATGPLRLEEGSASATAQGHRDQPSSTMAEGDSVVSSGEAEGLLRFGELTSHSQSVLKEEAVEASTSVTVHDLEVAGVLKIRGLVSRARAVHAGGTGGGGGEASTVVSGVEVAGIPARLGSDGLVFAGSAVQPPGTVDPVKEALSEAGLEVSALPAPMIDKGSAGTSSVAGTAGLQIRFIDDVGNELELAIAPATARAFAAGSNTALGGTGIAPDLEETTPDVDTSQATSPDVGSLAADSPGGNGDSVLPQEPRANAPAGNTDMPLERGPQEELQALESASMRSLEERFHVLYAASLALAGLALPGLLSGQLRRRPRLQLRLSHTADTG